MLVQSFEIIDDKKTLIAEGDIPEKMAKNLKVGDTLPLTQVKLKSVPVGSKFEESNEELLKGEFIIRNIETKQTKIGVEYIELILSQKW